MDEYQLMQHEALEGSTGVVNKANSILNFGSWDDIQEAEKDHDINLWSVMLRCREVMMRLTTTTSVQSEASYLTPHPHRVRAIEDMTPSQDVEGVEHVHLSVTLHPKSCRNCEATHEAESLAYSVVMVLPA